MSLSKTPLRYPGGKQKLAPFLEEILVANNLIDGHYVEAYAGGAGAAMELLLTKKVSHVHLNDSSFPIFCFWDCILNQTEQFCRLILSASLDVEEWNRQKDILANTDKFSPLEIGFSAFYMNRCNRSGVMNGGVIGGNDQTGEWKIDARFNRTELISRIEAIAFYKNRITVNNIDAEKYIKEYIPTTPRKTLVYCDPPYYEKSRDLYLNHYNKDDHKRLASVIQNKIKRKWVLSYDATPQIISYYRTRNYFLYDLQYNAAKVYKGREIFIFSDSLKLPETSQLKFISDPVRRLHRKISRQISK